MIARHSLLYLGAKLFGAGVNLGAVALFTRLAGAGEYGAYLLVLSQAFVLHGFALQWIPASFFARHANERAGAQAATALALTLSVLAGVAGFAGLTAMAGRFDAAETLAVLAMLAGIAAFELGVELARTRLEAGAVALTLVLRALLNLAFGAAALVWFGGGLALAAAIAAGNALGALACFVRLAPLLAAAPSRAAAREYLRFGWPLVFAFGASMLGQQIDRLLLAGLAGTAALGAYGALGDLIRQSFAVLGAAIALSVVSIARQASGRGDVAATRAGMEAAFVALAAVTALGGAFLLAFDEVWTALALGPEFRDRALPLVPYLVAGYALLIFRSFYFGQIIYFGVSSRVELAASSVLLVVSGGLGLALVPGQGAHGAALALIAGQAAAIAVFLLAGRRCPAMPLPLARGAGVAGIAGLFLLASAAIEASPLAPAGALALRLAAFALAGLATVWAFNVLHMRDAALARLETLRRRAGAHGSPP